MVNSSQFVQQLQDTFGTNFISAYRYGDDLESILLLFNQLTPDLYEKIKILFTKNKIIYSQCHLFTQKEFKEALDVFPLEFISIQESHLLLAGSDVLQNISINLNHLRHECEFYLRSNMLKLREAALHPKFNPTFIMKQSIGSYIGIFRSLFKLKGLPVPKAKKDVILQLANLIPFETSVFISILDALPQQKIDSLFPSYLKELDEIIDRIDHFYA